MTTREFTNLIEMKKHSRRILVFAHRGYSSLKPENSRSAIKLALTSKSTDGVEFDVQTTSDHKLLIRHNLSIQFGGKRQWIRDLSLKDIRTVLSKDSAPVFEDLILDFSQSKKLIDIEIKSPGIAKSLLNLIKTNHLYNQVIFTTIYPEIYREIRSLDHNIAIIFGYPRDRGKDLAQQKWTLPFVKIIVFIMKLRLKNTLSSIIEDIDTPFISLYHKMITKDIVDYLHYNNHYCIGATINLHDDTGAKESSRIMNQMLIMSTDCIKTDYPSLIK